MSTISLAEISGLCQALLAAQRATAKIENDLKVAKERERLLEEESIPNAMQELGLAELKLDTGEKVKVALEVYCSITAEKKEAAHQWLRDNGYDGLLKTEVAVQFGKGQNEEAQELVKLLVEHELEPALSEGVHAQTLKAFLKEQLAKGNEKLPLELFGARPVSKAKITAPK